MSSSISGNTSPTRNQLSSSLSRSFSIKEKGKQKKIEMQHTPDVVIDIPSEASSSSQENEFGKALLEELIDKFKTIEGVSVNETDIRKKELETIYSQNKKNIISNMKVEPFITLMGLGLFTGAILATPPFIRFLFGVLGGISSIVIGSVLKDMIKNFSKNKKIKQQINDLNSHPSQITIKPITPRQINDVFSEAFDDFFPDKPDEKDNKKFVHFFNKENEVCFVGDVNRIILKNENDDWHLTLRDDILVLKHKKEVTKEDFLDVIAQSIIPILEPYKTTERNKEKSFEENLLERAQGFVKKEIATTSGG